MVVTILSTILSFQDLLFMFLLEIIVTTDLIDTIVGTVGIEVIMDGTEGLIMDGIEDMAITIIQTITTIIMVSIMDSAATIATIMHIAHLHTGAAVLSQVAIIT